MARETLSVPEQYLEDVIMVIRAGLIAKETDNLNPTVVEQLTIWCNEQENYVKRLQEIKEEE